MGLYSNIVSTTKEIKQIRTFVEGMAKDIKSIWTFVENERKLIYPSNNLIVNLSGASKYEEDTIWPAGKYKVEIQAGGGNTASPDGTENSYSTAGKIVQQITVGAPFIIRAYCGSKATRGNGGTNPYSGVFKVNPVQGNVPAVNHIFGNCGGCSRSYFGGAAEGYGSGNCLGDGVSYTRIYTTDTTSYSCGAGSCLHLLPVGGTFGVDYLFAFHTTAAAESLGVYCQTGGGSAYGGSASGGASSTGSQGGTAQYGFTVGNTPYGNGGERSYSGTGLLAYGPGHDGTGIGHGYAGMLMESKGAAAWYNGSSWVQSDLWASPQEDGKIVITYLGEN